MIQRQINGRKRPLTRAVTCLPPGQPSWLNIMSLSLMSTLKRVIPHHMPLSRRPIAISLGSPSLSPHPSVSPLPPGIKREEAKVEKSLKEAAKQGDKDVALILAKEVLQSRKAVSKMYASMAQINSVMMSMDHQLGRSCDGHVIVTCHTLYHSIT